MSSSGPAQGFGSRAGGVLRTRLNRRVTILVRSLNADPLVFLGCIAATIAMGLINGANQGVVPMGSLVLPFLVGALFLSPRAIVFLDVVAAAMTAYIIARLGIGPNGARIGTAVVIALSATFAHVVAGSRERLGVKGLRGEAMLVDLRDRLAAQGRFPALPREWQADVVLRSAGGSSFGGDFMVASASDDGKRLELALVDVSGKGIDAGVRALQLSGALGGLLGSLPHNEFLAAANSYLVRQDWNEGFATAVHAAVDLVSGEFWVNSAGHPPAVHFDAGSGRWRTIEAHGPMLGLMPRWQSRPVAGTLRAGDALLLYTDGLTEARRVRELLGPARLQALLRGCAGLSAAAIIERLERGLADFLGAPGQDDVTLLALRALR